MSLTAAREDLRFPSRLSPAARRVRAIPLAVIALTLCAFLLRLSQIHQSLLGDEVSTYQQVAYRSFTGMLHAVHMGENAPPLFFVLSWLSAKLGNPAVWIRLPSLILGAATIPLEYALGRELAGRSVGLIAAAILAISPFSIYYGIEARPYATMMFFVALSTLAIVKATRTGEFRWWALWVVAVAGAVGSHYTAVFVLGVQAIWSLWRCWPRLRSPLLADAALGLLFLPWLSHVSGRELSIIGSLESLTLHNMLADVLRVIPGYPYASLRAIPTVAGLVAIGVCLLAGGIALLAGRARSVAAGERPGFGLICALAAATPVGLCIYSNVSTDIWDARDLYASVPALAILLGAPLAAIPSRLRPLPVAVVLLTLAVGTVRAISPSYARPPFRAAAHYLDEVAPPRDPVIMYPSFLGLTSDIPVEFDAPHSLVGVTQARWPQHITAARAFLVIDDDLDRALAIPIPHPSGYALVSHRHYGGLFNFTILGYRRVG